MRYAASLSCYWTLLCCLLVQFFSAFLSCKMQMQPQRDPRVPLEAKEQQQRPRGNGSVKRPATDYAKVELLHRLLVQQQLQQLQQRRLLQLALARRRLEFELSN